MERKIPYTNKFTVNNHGIKHHFITANGDHALAATSFTQIKHTIKKEKEQFPTIKGHY